MSAGRRLTLALVIGALLGAPTQARPGVVPDPAPPAVSVVRGLSYGAHPDQRMDLYVPHGARHAPVIVLVHGGGWRRGDKAMPGVVRNKVARWAPRGVIIVSVNYRMLPEADPLTQARDVARAVAVSQRAIARHGGSPDRFILMGHSAGGHLVALLAASPELARAAGVRPWLGTVLLDSGALDTVAQMRGPHAPLFDEAFGDDPQYWAAASPLQQLRQRTVPVLAVCSSLRIRSCPANADFVARARALGGRAQLLAQPLGHRAINVSLGEANAYTGSVEGFLRDLGLPL
ncbi:alpha/beta hydrolase [Agrilutibacter solisilvae]|uniref:Alpha/beta hydrolase n=1 Tax=Agrilutibacter solisilvae TaxID=2763317 RepID=A0A975ATX2_9GAMM|nr:alpha/beta hydrolase [Lysobacter solisilvae]QSX79793.1 alpha/beta hydrolase [Lysobacter solisilvae]